MVHVKCISIFFSLMDLLIIALKERGAVDGEVCNDTAD